VGSTALQTGINLRNCINANTGHDWHRARTYAKSSTSAVVT
jgi:hypothetical protein